MLGGEQGLLPPGPGSLRNRMSERGGRGAGRRVMPEGIRQELNRRRRVPYTVSMSFEDTREMPSSLEFGGWLIDQGLSPSNGLDVKRFSKSENDSRFYLQLEGEEMVTKFLEAVG